MIKNIKWIALGLLLGFLPTMLMGGAERL